MNKLLGNTIWVGGFWGVAFISGALVHQIILATQSTHGLGFLAGGMMMGGFFAGLGLLPLIFLARFKGVESVMPSLFSFFLISCVGTLIQMGSIYLFLYIFN